MTVETAPTPPRTSPGIVSWRINQVVMVFSLLLAVWCFYRGWQSPSPWMAVNLLGILAGLPSWLPASRHFHQNTADPVEARYAFAAHLRTLSSVAFTACWGVAFLLPNSFLPQENSRDADKFLSIALLIVAASSLPSLFRQWPRHHANR